jgi:hypothetical protein
MNMRWRWRWWRRRWLLRLLFRLLMNLLSLMGLILLLMPHFILRIIYVLHHPRLSRNLFSLVMGDFLEINRFRKF